MRIEFGEGERIPLENDADFTRGVGFIVKTCALLHGVGRWKEILEEQKETYYPCLEVIIIFILVMFIFHLVLLLMYKKVV